MIGDDSAVLTVLESILLVLVERRVLCGDDVVQALEDAAAALREEGAGAECIRQLTRMAGSVSAVHADQDA